MNQDKIDRQRLVDEQANILERAYKSEMAQILKQIGEKKFYINPFDEEELVIIFLAMEEYNKSTLSQAQAKAFDEGCEHQFEEIFSPGDLGWPQLHKELRVKYPLPENPYKQIPT